MLLAAATSIAGLVVSVVAAADGNASLAVSNSVGGIAAQTAFLALADIAYRGVNLEHAAASLTNVFNSLLMVVLLAIVLAGVASPDVTVLAIHPATPLLLAAYGYGIWLSREVGRGEMWRPAQTAETVIDKPDREAHEESTARLWVTFLALGIAISVVGWAVGRSGLSLVAATGLTGTIVGVFLTSVSTSLPELITAVAAVRAGAPTLAIGGIVGGNTFDAIFIAFGDGAFRAGSIYEAVDRVDIFVIAWTILLVSIAGAGLVRRQRKGIGFEGIAILAVYVAGLVVVVAS